MNAGRFWVQDASDDTQQELALIFYSLNECGSAALAALSTHPQVGQMVIAPYKGDLYRARVTSLQSQDFYVTASVSF